MELKEISAVICAKNEHKRIKKCVEGLRAIGVGEIIVVDGSSNDRTAEIAEKVADVVLQDKGIGIGAARNIGISAATRKLVLNFGVDNEIERKDLQKMVDDLLNNDYSSVSAQTRTIGADYLSRCLDMYKRARFRSGERDVVGTPSLFEREKLLSYMFDERAVYSDDSELCLRMKAEEGAKFFISDAVVLEFGENSFAAIKRRWLLYGKSDFEVYSRHHKRWSKMRKFQSIIYPLKKELIEPLFFHRLWKGLYILPFLILITFTRYFGWFKNVSLLK